MVAITFPTTITQGDSYTTTYTLEDYPSNDGWSLYAHIQGNNTLTIVCTVDTLGNYVLDLTTVETSTLSPGSYQIVFYVTKTGQRIVVSKLLFDVAPDFLSDTATDFRSFNQKMVDALEALLLRRADNFQLDLLRTSIDAKEFERMSVDDIQMLLDKYKMKVQNEQRTKKGRSPWGRRVTWNFNQDVSEFYNTYDEINKRY